MAVDRNVIVQAAWNGYAVAANSQISSALKFWHDTSVDAPKAGLAVAREMLEKAGYKLVDGKLHYPAGIKETLQPI